MSPINKAMELLIIPDTIKLIKNIAYSHQIPIELHDDFYQFIFEQTTKVSNTVLQDCLDNNRLINLISTIAINNTKTNSKFFKIYRNNGFYYTKEVTTINTEIPTEPAEERIEKLLRVNQVLRIINTLKAEIKNSHIRIYMLHYYHNYTVKQISNKLGNDEKYIHRVIRELNNLIAVKIKQEKIKHNQ